MAGIRENQKSPVRSFSLVAVMILYKDLGFFISSINGLGALLGRAPGLQLPQWLAPFGISYYTLILTGYLLDVRWETVEQPQKNPLKLLLFAGYFPQLTSGPFSRYNDLSPALLGNVQWDARNFRFSLQRFLWGLCKKLIVADRLAVAVAALTGWIHTEIWSRCYCASSYCFTPCRP